ncbi:hypothetical protein [Candidatus Bathycorpusculum sp.]|uniref:hypothetical protein n=1 Tax=Candidatus Bathycorpusculum sp. TaxID=2994959 RepID=UPI00281A8569|nr:hypothetical protein [Candidatus Termitimicrobium sp.]MCL2685495.1 hypothetical protein [Candidatus Termitimicrobium sp.]
MKSKTQKGLAAIIMFALVIGCFAVMPLKANAASTYTEPTAHQFYAGGEDVLYAIVKGYTGPWCTPDRLNYPGLNGGGEFFYIAVTNTYTNEEFASFCAHAGSKNFAGDNTLGCSGYMTSTDFIEGINTDDFVYALNYIEDHLGNLNEGNNRVITQTVMWAILGAINVKSDAFSTTSLNNEQQQLVRDAIDAIEEKYVGEGKIVDVAYLTCENHEHDFEYCQPQLVPLYKTPTTQYGELRIEKTVDGIAFKTWLNSYTDEEARAIRLGVQFALYKANEDDGSYDETAPIATVRGISVDGYIDFAIGKLESGYYAVVETLITPEAKAVFKEANAPLYFHIRNTETGHIFSDFDYDAFYTIQNGWGNTLATLNHGNLNMGGIIFPIGVTNTKTGTTYPSFCAHGGSQNFAGQSGIDCSGYMVASKLGTVLPDKYGDFVLAYNYIETNYGDLNNNDNRIITQIVTWVLLESIDTADIDYGMLGDVSDANIYSILDVLDHFDEQEGGRIVDLVYMVCENPNHEFKTCQPQLVPVYGEDVTFDNKVQQYGSITLSYDVGTKVNIKDSITGGYSSENIVAREKQAHNLDQKLGTKGNWFQFNEFSNGIGGTFELINGNNLAKVGEYTIEYNPNTQEYTLTFSDELIGSSAQLSISNTFILNAKNANDIKKTPANVYSIPDPGNSKKTIDYLTPIWTSAPGQQQFSLGNGHSFTFKAPWVDTNKPVYVYLHLGGLTGYANTDKTPETIILNVYSDEACTIRACEPVEISRHSTGSTELLKTGQYYYTITAAGLPTLRTMTSVTVTAGVQALPPYKP